MQGFSNRCAVIGALVLGACGSPAELDEDAFPTLDKTGYSASGVGAGGSTTEVTGSVGGSSGAPVATGGSSGMGTGGSQGQTSGGSMGGMGTTGGSSGGAGCPSDITVLFSRPIAQGGCTAGGGCHEAGSPIKPDLVSPNVASRLLNVPSSCEKTSSGMTVGPRPYISKDDSFLEEKIAGSPDSDCGISMPFFMPEALSAADEQCIVAWIDQVAGGG